MSPPTAPLPIVAGQADTHPTRGPTVRADSAALYAEVARGMTVHGSVSRTQTQVVSLAVEIIDGCDAADVMMVDRTQRLRTVAYSIPAVYMAGLLQRHNHAGPSLTALSLGNCVVDDFASDRRWPRLSAWASSHGLASACACPLETDRRTLGVLNLYSRHPGVFTDTAVAHAGIFAAHAALAIDGVWVETELATSFTGQRLIGQAVGILMERFSLSAEAALQRCLATSHRLDLTVLELAATVVQTGVEPVLPNGSRTSSVVGQAVDSRYAVGVAFP